jgi:two-component system chemotaxis response regulator CheY
LETLDLQVREAGDGREALEACLEEVPDVILLDWNMPVMSGMDFLRALRDANLARRPRIVFCTTENGMAHIRAAIDAGADEYIMKPFDRDTLESKLQLVGMI